MYYTNTLTHTKKKTLFPIQKWKITKKKKQIKKKKNNY